MQSTDHRVRIGQGIDVHALVTGRPLVLGGVTVPFNKGLAGHSDADVLLHAICDACLGAIGAGDIGQHFPDTDAQYESINSRNLLREVAQLVTDQGLVLANLDATIVAQAPKLAPYLQEMGNNIAADLNVDPKIINIKATTTENLGALGRGDGIAALAVVLLQGIPGGNA